MIGIRSTFRIVAQNDGRFAVPRSLTTLSAVLTRPINPSQTLLIAKHYRITPPALRFLEARRFQSDKAPPTGDKTNASDSNSSPDNNEIMLTPGEKVVVGTRLTLWTAALVFASACAYYIGRELFPSKMSPNSAFNSSFELVRDHPDVTKRFGAPLKAYGRDHGGHREGRRNFVEHTEYTDPEDGSKRTRVRYNLEGQAGNAFVFAEVSSDLPSGEFVYILVQDKRNGYVTTVVDNRSAMMTKRLAAGNKEGEAALSALLGGGGKQ